MTAGDSGWQPPGFLKATGEKMELQVCQTRKHALITRFLPADDNEVTRIIAVFFFCWVRAARSPRPEDLTPASGGEDPLLPVGQDKTLGPERRRSELLPFGARMTE